MHCQVFCLLFAGEDNVQFHVVSYLHDFVLSALQLWQFAAQGRKIVRQPAGFASKGD